MKAEELMIGDWVNGWDGRWHPIVISAISSYPYNRPSAVAVGGYGYAIEDQLQPILLTPEILEKNGFDPNGIPEEVMPIEERDYSDDTYVWSNASNECDTHCQVCVYIDYHNNVCLFEAFTSDSHIDGIKIRYVHQLQQALRLCGINKKVIL